MLHVSSLHAKDCLIAEFGGGVGRLAVELTECAVGV